MRWIASKSSGAVLLSMRGHRIGSDSSTQLNDSSEAILMPVCLNPMSGIQSRAIRLAMLQRCTSDGPS